MHKVLLVVFVGFGVLSCKPVHRSEGNSSSEDEVPKALFGTWVLEDTSAPQEVVLGDAIITYVRRIHFKIERSQISYIVYCDGPSGQVSVVGTSPAAITSDTLSFEKPEIKSSGPGSWCQAEIEAPRNPVRYSLVNDALHISFYPEQGEKVLHHAR